MYYIDIEPINSKSLGTTISISSASTTIYVDDLAEAITSDLLKFADAISYRKMKYHGVKAKLSEISSDTHQLHCIPKHHFIIQS